MLLDTVPSQVESVRMRLFQAYLTSHNGRATAQLNPRARAPKRGFLVLSDVPPAHFHPSEAFERVDQYVHSNWLLASARPGYRVFCLWQEGTDFHIGIQEWCGSFDRARTIARRNGYAKVWDIRLDCPRTI